MSTGGDAFGIPLFARKYNTTCFTCHTTEPLLNEFGRRFQANGYQLPGTRERLAQKDQPVPPLAVILMPMIGHTSETDNLSGTSTSSTSFSGIEVGLFSSGSLGSHVAYFVETPVSMMNGEGHIEVNDAHVIYSDLLGNGLGNINLRLGKMRLFVPFIPNTMLSGNDPVIYGYDPLSGQSANDLLFAAPTYAASAFGNFPQLLDGLRWEIAMTGGTNSDVDLSSAHAFFAALNQTVFLQNAPIRVGLFYYGGMQDVSDTTISPTSWSNMLTRMGFDLEAYDPWTKRFDFTAQYITATDDNIDHAGGTLKMTGGFAGVNVIVSPETLYLFGRYDVMKVTETNDLTHQIDIGIHYHLQPNVLLVGTLSSMSETLPSRIGGNAGIDRKVNSLSAGVLFGF